MPLPVAVYGRPDDFDPTQTEVGNGCHLWSGQLRGTISAVRHMPMKPIFSLMGIACAQLA
jgi:hypothetical protein